MATRPRRALSATPLLAGLAVLGCAQQTLLCQRPEVLQEAGRIVRQWNLYNAIDETSAREAPTSRANAVVCDAALLTVAYEPIATGWRPLPLRQNLRYTVQVSGNRFAVEVPR